MAEFDLLRQMPHSQEAEQALLGAVLLNPEKFDEIVFLKPEYFFQEQHRQIYIAMLDMYNNNRSKGGLFCCGKDPGRAGRV